MGRFSTTVHIKSGLGATKFINSFCEVMKKRGFVKCTEDECALSYFMAFSEGGWVTLSSDKYSDDPRKAKDDARQIAEGMKTAAFSVEVVDSDFAILTLNDGDSIIVGNGSGYGFEDAPKGERSKWEPLLAEGKTWEQLAECRDKSEVFVEDALWEAAQILGLEPEYICADFEELSGKADGDKNISALYFKKAGSKGKAMSLNAAFVKVFGEGLEPMGFKKIKSRYPYYVRVVPGGEIVHIITYRTESDLLPGEKHFNILGGVATVYKDDIDLTQDPFVENIEWLLDNRHLLYLCFEDECDREFEKSIFKFSYICDDENSLLSEMYRALDTTKQVMLPAISKAVDIDTCIVYLLQIHKLAGFDEWGEGLLYLKTPNYAEIIEVDTKRWHEINKHNLEKQKPGYSQEEYEQQCRRGDEVIEREITAIKEILTTPELLKKYMEEMERRKAANLEIFRSYGLDI